MGTQIRTPLPVYTNGTVSGNSGTPVITGVGTNWTTLDASNNTINSVMGGDSFITVSGSIPIKSVDSATQITLECNLAATINAGSAYRILKISPNQTGGVTNALASVLLQGSDGTPDTSRTIDNGSGRVKVRIGAAGDAQIAVGLPNAVDAALVTAIDMSQAGLVTFPAGASIPSIYGRNRLRNSNFPINQRNVTGTVTLAAGAYGHDGVKGGASGATYTFATSGADTVPTVTAGSIILPIEAGLIEGGTYVVSQAGTAQARVWQGTGSTGSGAYASVPFSVTGLAAGTQTNIEFSTGTVNRAQFEAGAVATNFERRPLGLELLLCQRYYQQFGGNSASEVFATGVCAPAFAQFFIPLRVRMRVSPLVSFANLSYLQIYDGINGYAPTGIAFVNTTIDGISFGFYATLTSGRGAILQAVTNSSGLIQISADL